MGGVGMHAWHGNEKVSGEKEVIWSGSSIQASTHYTQ